MPRENEKSRLTDRKNLWILKLVDSSNAVAGLNRNINDLFGKDSDAILSKGLCVVCKGSRLLCGKTRCPLTVRLNSYLGLMRLIDGTDVDGVSPPGVFIGRMGYPNVYAGPLVPPLHEDTSYLDLPELWFGKSMDEIVTFRSMLVRGEHRVHVNRFEEAGKIMDQTRELALSVGPVDVELALKNRPHRHLVLDDQIQPFGPSANILEMQIGNSKWDHKIEKAHGDTDLKAAEAVTSLYDQGVLVSRIQKAFSVAAFGLKQRRKLVPTRWSITAVDSIISKNLMKEVRTFPEINEYRVYESSYLDNQFEVLMIPSGWGYESMEAWYPGTVWNPGGNNIVLFSDWEAYEDRTTYAEIGGCYYAARLAVCELLAKERRQATVVVLREARPGYIMPVGVWQVRENVRNAMKQPPFKCNTLEEALKRVASQFQIPISQWITSSRLIRNALYQKRITEYLTKNNFQN